MFDGLVIMPNKQLPDGWEQLSIDELLIKIKDERRWYRKTLGILYYHNYMCAQFELKRGLKWTVAKTGERLGMSVGAVSEAINLGKMMDNIDEAYNLTREEALVKMREMRK